MSIAKPAGDGNSMLGVEDIRGGTVVDNNRITEISPNLREVFHIVSLVVVATLAEETMMDSLMNVELVQ